MWTFVPSAPCMVTVYVPVAVFIGTVIVTVEGLDAVTDVGLKAAVNPPVAVYES